MCLHVCRNIDVAPFVVCIEVTACSVCMQPAMQPAKDFMVCVHCDRKVPEWCCDQHRIFSSCPPRLCLLILQVQLSGSVSSQYLTALLMAAPLATGTEGIEIIIKDELVSQPYVDMTVKLMERFGVEVQQLDGLTHMRIPPAQT